MKAGEIEVVTHDQLEGRIAEFMVNAGWIPALTEIEVGSVLGVDKEAQRKRGRRGPEGVSYWRADVTGCVRATPSRLKKLSLQKFAAMARESEYKYYGYEPLIWSWLIEVKVQRSDFVGETKFEARPEAHLQFVAYPDGLIKPDEIPAGWGGLEVHSRGVRRHTEGITLNDLRPEQPVYLIAALARALWSRKGKDRIARRDRLRKMRPSRASRPLSSGEE